MLQLEPKNRSAWSKLQPKLEIQFQLLLQLETWNLILLNKPLNLTVFVIASLLCTSSKTRSKMACGSSKCLYDRNGPGSAATSIAESIIKPSEATGTKTKCIECGDYECCCIPCTIL
ncbi:hypothetical protein F52700_13289 [Fusarium sp. NRRL 52700]|nr:hypothetical protein F52700_13289 [Fusarium sp. NRRL 52700]